MRTYYAHLVDVLRKYNPQLTEQNIEDDELLRNQDVEQILARIEDVESRFESLTGNPFREVRVGNVNRPETWEHRQADLHRHQSGIKFWLEHGDILPFDSSKGDAVEIRRGRNNWMEITGREDRYQINYRKGWIRIFTRFAQRYLRVAARDDALRVTYRHGALGGNSRSAGQTKLTSDVSDNDTTLDVEDADRLPNHGILFIGGDEYVSLNSSTSSTIDVVRGVRATSATSHSSDTVVHYCPLEIREAVAAKAAQQLLQHEGWVVELTSGDGLNASQKIEEWESTWMESINDHKDVRAI